MTSQQTGIKIGGGRKIIKREWKISDKKSINLSIIVNKEVFTNKQFPQKNFL